MEEDLLKRRLLSNYCYWFLKEDIKEHICLMRFQKEKRKVEKMNNKDIQNIAIAMLESIKIKYKALRELEKLNQEKGIFNSDLSLYLEYLRETDGLKFDDEGNLIE